MPRIVVTTCPTEHEGTCYTLGAAASKGYREFKTTDGYEDVIVGVVVLPCGQVADASASGQAEISPVPGGTEIATFEIGGQLLGLAAGDVIECIEVANAVKLPGGARRAKRHVGLTTWCGQALPLFDMSEAMGQMAQPQRHAIVLKHEGVTFGLLVSELGPIVELALADERSMQGINGELRLVTRIATSGSMLVPVLSVANVLASLSGAIAAEKELEPVALSLVA